MAEEIQEQFGIAFRVAERLMRTETSFLSNQADLAAYQRTGIEWYRWLASVDTHTCGACRKLDGQVFEVKKAEAGVTLPPLHPNDRCTTVPAQEGDVLGQGELFPKDMTYGEWRRWQEAGGPEDVQAWIKGHREAVRETRYQVNDGMYRRTGNSGIFASLPERMTKKHIRAVAKEMGISMKGLSLVIDLDSSKLSKAFGIYGRADTQTIGRINFYPLSFVSERRVDKDSLP